MRISSTTVGTVARVGLLGLALGAGALSLGPGLAAADDMKPSPWVTSGQGEVRKSGTQGEFRGGDILEAFGQGEVRQSPIAVPVTKARGFQGINVGPGLGGW